MNEKVNEFRDLCEDVFELLQRVSPQGHFLYVNRAWRETLGYSAEDVTGLRLLNVIHPDSQPYFDRISRQLPGEPGIHGEVRFKRKDGGEILAEGIAGCHFRGGQPVETYGIFRDVGAGRNAEEELNRLFNLSQDLLCIAGVDGYFRQINPAFLQVLGYSREELLSRSFLEFVHPDDRESTLKAVEQLAQGLLVVDFQNRYRTRDGTFKWLAWRSTPWAERGLIYAVARDITEQKRIQELINRQALELARSNADLEEFAHIASHDLRTPLRAVTNLAEWIEEDMRGQPSERVRNHLEKLRLMVQRMDRLTDDILQYSRVGREPDQICLVDTDALLKELTFLLSPPEGFTVSWDPGMPVFDTAKSPLGQVFRNLIGNAIKHHDGRGGKVQVTVRDQAGFYEFSVIDDGPGIPLESREKIFTMFYKLRANEQMEGNGIGLALVKRIVERHGGCVWVESSAGSGATFRFLWPKRIESNEGCRAGHSDS